MDEEKTFLSLIPEHCWVYLYAPDGMFLVAQSGSATNSTPLGEEVIRILHDGYYDEASEITPETLHEFADIKSWQEGEIQVRWKSSKNETA